MTLDESSIKFKKIEKQLPNSWEEYTHKDNFLLGTSWETYLPKEYKALRQLELLRDCYNDGWLADWSETSTKPVIQFQEGELRTDSWRTVQTFLNFKTADLRDKFLKNFKDIIEIAKPLL